MRPIYDPISQGRVVVGCSHLGAGVVWVSLIPDRTGAHRPGDQGGHGDSMERPVTCAASRNTGHRLHTLKLKVGIGSDVYDLIT